jgi:adenylate cyclase
LADVTDTERRLVAIFAADVEGYSRLMGANEVETLQALTQRRTILDGLISAHRGRIANTAGDSVLAEFGSAVDAVQCAVEAQVALAAANVSTSPDRHINFRIGVHVGDVMIKGGDLFGDSVNVAARLQTMAMAGSVCISGVAYDQVRKILPFAFTDLGAQQVKNIEEPVRAFAVAAKGAAAVDLTGSSPASADNHGPLPLPDKPSIAVLPFQNMSGDPEQEYFADGMVDDIITGLSRIKWLFVIARNSTFAYKGRAVDVKQIGRELGVRYVLEGSVRKATERVRITGQLIDAGTGAHVWAERYDRKSDDIFALQDEMALSVVGAIEPSLRRAEVERVQRKRPDSLDAYDLVLRAQTDVFSGMPESAIKALAFLDRALRIDSAYALAHAFAAMCHHNLFLRAGLHEEERAASIRHARAAIVHGQDDALALTFAGFSIGMDGHDRAAAFAAFEAALAVSPSSALTYILGSVVLAWGGEAERAIEWGERAMRLSPFDPWAFAAYHSLILGHFHRSRFEEAANAAHKAVQSNPAHSISHMLLAAALVKLGRFEAARVSAAEVLRLQPAFRYGRQFAGVDCAPALAASLGETLRAIGLPE